MHREYGMKAHFFAAGICVLFSTVSCNGIWHKDDASYVPRLPELPQAWETVLGRASWKLEWFDGSGARHSAVIGENGTAAGIALNGTMANPVLAMPFWPEKGVEPGLMRPAGAVFPFDVSGNNIILSWASGVEAAFFMELARAAGTAGAQEGSAAIRLPWNFNWPRFRRLFSEEALNDDVRLDPWLAAWESIADRTVASGFDRRRLVPEARSDLELPLGSGPWIGSSPFSAPLYFEGNPVFPVRATADTWVCARGILRASGETWIWREF